MYVTFTCYRTGARGQMYFRIPVWEREILRVCEWFSTLNDNHLVIAQNALGHRIAGAGAGLSSFY